MTLAAAWPFVGLPDRCVVIVDGERRRLRRSRLHFPGVVAVYRESVAVDSLHLDVVDVGGRRWCVTTHADRHNPDAGPLALVAHGVVDVVGVPACCAALGWLLLR